LNQRQIFHLSTNMLPMHRKNVINKIENLLSSKDKNNIILITTQIIEAGIDVSFDKIIRDLGPLYSIIQVAGRCNRNASIINYDELPIIDIMNINNSHKKVYDSMDIELTRDFFNKIKMKMNNSVNQTNEYIICSESELRNNFSDFVNAIIERKNLDCLKNEFESFNFSTFTKQFKIINEKPKKSLIILPNKEFYEKFLSFNPNDYQYVEEFRNNTNINYIPQKMFSYIIDLFQNEFNEFRQILDIYRDRIRTNDDPNREPCFYVIDLNGLTPQEIKNFYDDDVGLKIYNE